MNLSHVPHSQRGFIQYIILAAFLVLASGAVALLQHRHASSIDLTASLTGSGVVTFTTPHTLTLPCLHHQSHVHQTPNQYSHPQLLDATYDEYNKTISNGLNGLRRSAPDFHFFLHPGCRRRLFQPLAYTHRLRRSLPRLL